MDKRRVFDKGDRFEALESAYAWLREAFTLLPVLGSPGERADPMSKEQREAWQHLDTDARGIGRRPGHRLPAGI